MTPARTLKTAFRALRRNLMRAFLTTLGIVIGVGAVIAMMEIGHGSSTAIQRTVASMGAASLMVFPGQASSAGVSFGGGTTMTLTAEDCEAILRECPAVRAAAPMIRARTQVIYGNKNWVPQDIHATTPDYLVVREWAATFASCVTRMIVRPCSSLSVWNMRRTSSLVFESRFPVGSSAKRTGGLLMSDRAIATRCCWPPESCDG